MTIVFRLLGSIPASSAVAVERDGETVDDEAGHGGNVADQS